ncbi:kelch repeat-containing protein, partial [Gloeocapsa sp. BRSZ]
QSKKVDVTFDYFGVNSLGSPNPDFNQINWSTAKSSPLGRTEASGIVANNKLYVFGGYIDNTFTPTKQSHVYNPVTNAWQRIADLPTAISHAGIAVAGNNIYLAGGYPGKQPKGQTFATNEVWRYNTVQNKWFSMPSLPAARGSGELAVLNGRLHFFGGVNANRIDQGNHWVLPLNGSQWTSLAPLPNPRSHMADAVVGGKLYAIGGQVGKEHEGAQATVNVYHPETNTWKSAKSLPQALSHISASTFVMDGKIIVAGGMLANGTDISEVKAYDPLSNSWSTLSPIPAPRSSGVAGRIGNNIFFATGASPGFSATTFKGAPIKNQVVSNNAQALYRINVGSSTAYTDSNGNTWSP